MKVGYIEINSINIAINVMKGLFQIKSNPCTTSNTYKYSACGNVQSYRFNDLPCEYWNVYIRRRN